MLLVQSLTWCRARSHRWWDHDLSGNQELEAQPTEPPRHPGCCKFFEECVASNRHWLNSFVDWVHKWEEEILEDAHTLMEKTNKPLRVDGGFHQRQENSKGTGWEQRLWDWTWNIALGWKFSFTRPVPIRCSIMLENFKAVSPWWEVETSSNFKDVVVKKPACLHPRMPL